MKSKPPEIVLTLNALAPLLGEDAQRLYKLHRLGKIPHTLELANGKPLIRITEVPRLEPIIRSAIAEVYA